MQALIPPSAQPGPPPRLLFGLLLIYPVLTHSAVYFRSLWLTVAAAMALLLVMLRQPLRSGRWWAWLTVLAGGGLLAWAASAGSRDGALYALYSAPVLIYLFLAWVFGSTLWPGQQALIARIAQQLHGKAHVEQPDVGRYTRRLTALWTALFLLLALINGLLALLATPDGVLELLGLASPRPLPATWWSLFANVLSFCLVLLLFALEFAYRRRRFPQQHARYRGLLDFLMHMRDEMPALMRPRASALAEEASGVGESAGKAPLQ